MLFIKLKRGGGVNKKNSGPIFSLFLQKRGEGGAGEGGGAKDPPPISTSGSGAFDIWRIFLIICNVLATFPKFGMTV